MRSRNQFVLQGEPNLRCNSECRSPSHLSVQVGRGLLCSHWKFKVWMWFIKPALKVNLRMLDNCSETRFGCVCSTEEKLKTFPAENILFERVHLDRHVTHESPFSPFIPGSAVPLWRGRSRCSQQSKWMNFAVPVRLLALWLCSSLSAFRVMQVHHSTHPSPWIHGGSMCHIYVVICLFPHVHTNQPTKLQNYLTVLPPSQATHHTCPQGHS